MEVTFKLTRMMKKRVFSLMAMAALLAALVSCSREKEVEMIEPAGDVTYRFELAGGTKATLDDEGVWWEANDHVGVFLDNAHSNPEVQGDNDTKYVEVTGPSGVSKGYAYYPNVSANTSAGAVTVRFPATQEGGSHSAMPMAGIPFNVPSGKIHFLNLGSVIDFRVYSPTGKYAGELVKSITFTATSGDHPVSGDATLNLTTVNQTNESSLAVNWAGGFAESSVTLTQSSASAMDKVTAAGRHLYMVLAPGTYSGTIAIETSAATYTYTFSEKSFERNGLQRYNMNLESAAAARESYYVKTNSVGDGGTFLIVYESSNTSAKVFHPVLNGSNYTGSVVDADITSKGILATEDVEACLVVLEKVSGNQNNQYYVKVPSANNSYLNLSRWGNTYSMGTGQNALTFSFDSDGKVQISRTSYNQTTYLRYNNNSFTASNSASSLTLYKMDDGGLTEQTPQFSSDSFLYNITEQTLPVENVEGVPVLSGAQTNVTYYSSDKSVATVDASNGQVTILGAGRTTITAVAEANSVYHQGLASYILRVNEGFSVENDRVAAFLDYEEEHPYNPNDYSYTYVMEYREGTGQNNRLDIPEPVPVTWTTSVSNPTVVIYKDQARTDEEIMAFTEDETPTSANVYNLIPGRTYYYVVKEGDQVKAEGSFKTTGRRRMIKVWHSEYGKCYANNCRDFGGQTTTDGRRIKFGKIYRGTNMDKTTDDQKNYLINKMGIGVDVDLRSTGTNTSDGDNKSSSNYALGNGQYLGEGVYRTPENYNSWSTLSDASLMKNTVKAVFDYVAAERGVYIHCKIGADRTAYVCLLLEAILGVPQHLCDVDYELTSFCGCLDNGWPRRRDKTDQSYYYYRNNGISFLTGSTLQGSTLQEKAVYYVTHDLGISAEKVTAFQNAMLEPVNQQ